MATRELYWIGGTGNWSDTAHWALAADGTGAPQAVPDSDDNVHFGASSFSGADQVVTVNTTANTLDLDWTGATNTPTLNFLAVINIYGSLVTIGEMNCTGAYYLNFFGAAKTVTTNGLTFSQSTQFRGSTQLLDAFTTTGTYFTITDGASSTGSLDTNGQTVTCKSFYTGGTGVRTLTLGASVINCTSFDCPTSTNLTVTANTATINVTGTGAVALGTANWNGADFNLNGTAHTVSGSPTGIAVFTRNGTATKTDTLTLTSGATLTCTTFAMIGNSATNRLLVQSSTLGTAATVTATNWTGADNFDLMDITATNAVDLSGVSSGDCGGNTGITFTTAAAQISNAAGNWSTLATWQDGVGTDRVPLPQDDVSCSHDVTVDMYRIGKSITITGTPTVTVSNAINIYGSLTLATGMTFTHNSNDVFFRGRSSYTLTSAGKGFWTFYIYIPSGTLTLQDAFSAALFTLYNGTFTTNSKDMTISSTFGLSGSATKVLNLGSSILTLTRTIASTNKWALTATGTTLNAGTSTIILTNSTANAQTFAGGGLTYNHVRVEGAGAYTLTITGDNTFEKLRNDSSAAVKTILLTPTSTQTIRNLQVFSSAANVAVFNTGGAAATIQKHRGYCELNHVNLTSIVAGEKYKYYAGNNSTDGTGNTNWIFTHKARAVD